MASDSLKTTNAVYSAGKFGAGMSAGYGVTRAGALAALVAAGKGSIALWASFTANGGTQIAFGSGKFGYIGVSGSGYAAFNVLPPVVSNGTTILGNAALTDGVLHYLVMTYDGTNLSGYVDGVLIRSVAVAGVLTTATVGPAVKFGIRSMDDSGFLMAPGGVVDALAIYDTVIDGTVVPTSPPIGNEAGLVGLWQLDGNGASGLLGGNALSLFSTTNALALSGTTFGGAGPYAGTEALTGGYAITPEGIATACIAAKAISLRLRFRTTALPPSAMVALGTTSLVWLGVNTLGYGQISMTGGPNLNGQANVCDGGWHDFLMCYDGTSGVLDGYVDGVWLGQGTLAGLLTEATIGDLVAFGIGAFETGGNPWANGAIADVRIYNTIVATGDVSPPAPEAPVVGTEPGLIAAYPLDGNGADVGPNIGAGAPSYGLSLNGTDLALDGGFACSPPGILAGAAATGEFTIVADGVRSGVPGALEIIAGMEGVASCGVSAQGYAQFNLASGDTVIATGAFVADGAEHVLQMSYDTAKNTFYGLVDGLLVGTALVGLGIPALVATGRLGIRAMDTGASVFAGQVRQVSVWNKVLDRISYEDDRAYSGLEPGLAGLWPLNGSGTDMTNQDVQTVAHDDPDIYFTPNNWVIDPAGYRMSISAGAYFKMAFQGNKVVLNFNTSYLGSPRTQIYCSIDGLPKIQLEIASSISLEVPDFISAAPWHTLEVEIKSTSETLVRWSDVSPVAVMLQSIRLEKGSAWALCSVKPLLIEYIEDSLGEGVRTRGELAVNDTDRNDALVGCAMAVGRYLNAEVTMHCYGGSGICQTGSGNIPPINDRLGHLTPSNPRNWQIAPDVMVWGLGTNDKAFSSAVFQAAAVSALTTAMNNLPSTRHIIAIPFDQSHAADWRAVAATLNNTRVSVIDTTGFLDTAYGIDSAGLHPPAGNVISFVAPKLAQAIQKVLGASNTPSYVFS